MNCFLRSKEGKNCGPSRGSGGVIRLSECNDQVENHLSCHLSKESINESELTLARADLFNLSRDNLPGMWICYKHRHILGRFWRSSKVTCQYPEHSDQKKRVKGRDTINLQMAQDIYKLFGVIVPVGSGSFSITICSCAYFYLPFVFDNLLFENLANMIWFTVSK